MAKFAAGSNTQIGAVKEQTIGTTPPTPTYEQVRYSSFDVSTSKTELLDTSITGTRDYPQAGTGNQTVAGTLESVYSPKNQDAFLEAALFGTFTANVLEAAKIPDIVSYSMKERFTDIDTEIHNTGIVFNTVTVNSPINALATISFGLLGKQQVAQADTNTTFTPISAEKPFTSCGGLVSTGDVGGGNLTPIAVVQGISFTIDNQIDTNFVWGSCNSESFTPGKLSVTGTLTVFFPDATLINKYLDDERLSLQVRFDNLEANGTHEWLFPHIQLTGATVPVSGEGPVSLTVPFRALYDETTTTTVTVTRGA